MDSSRRHPGGGGAPGPVPGASGRAAAVAALLCFALGGCANPAPTLRRLDDGHALISRGLADVVDASDRAFGDPRVEDRERIVAARLGPSVTLRDNNGDSWSFPLSLRVPLPALERRANVFLQLNTTTDQFGSLGDAASALDRNKTLTATVLTRVADLIDTGAKLDLFWEGGPHTGLRPFARYEWRRETIRFLLEQQIYLNTDIGPGEKSIAQVDHVIGGKSFVRLLATARAEAELAGIAQEYAVIYRRAVPRWDAALSAELGARYNRYDGDPVAEVRGAEADPDESYARVRLTGKVLLPWIEYEVSPGFFHPWRHEDTWEFGITLAVRFIYEDYLRRGSAPPPPSPPVPPRFAPPTAPPAAPPEPVQEETNPTQEPAREGVNPSPTPGPP